MSYSSHGETPHYYRRYCVSLLSSAWNQVGPQCYGRHKFPPESYNLKVSLKLIQAFGISLSPQNPLGVVWLSHGQLVQVSSRMPRSTYTPCLSTPCSLRQPFRTLIASGKLISRLASRLDAFSGYHSNLAYRAHSDNPAQRFVHSGPLVPGSSLFQFSERPRQIGTEPLQYVLNPARVPPEHNSHPLDRLQPQDVMSRHRGAKHRRRYELWAVSACYPRVPLSVERWLLHSEPPDHYDSAHLLELSFSQSSGLMPLH